MRLSRQTSLILVVVAAAIAACGEDSLRQRPVEEIPAGGIRGRLCQRAYGQWLGGAIVTIDDGSERSVVADADGAFEFTDLEPGNYQLHVVADGYDGSRNAVVTAGKVTDIGVSDCVTDRGNVDGYICNTVDHLGIEGALANIMVGSQEMTATTDINGFFLISDVPIGDHTLTVIGSGVDLTFDITVEAFLTTSVGEPACGPPIVDTFTQGWTATGQADILFIIDSSASMNDEQVRLNASLQTFITWLNGSEIDYHLAVTTADMSSYGEQGAFVGTPAVLTATTPNVAQSFMASAMVGTTGDYIEEGFAAAKAALTEPMVSNANAGFLRPDARLHLVFVSDEEDQSPDPVEDYISFFNALKGNIPDAVFYAAIAGPPPSGCDDYNQGWYADGAQRYYDITTNTGGLFGTICQGDFGTTLEDLAVEVISSAGEYVLSGIPVQGTLEVRVDDIVSPQVRWLYNEVTNSFSFLASWVPVAGSQITATYQEVP